VLDADVHQKGGQGRNVPLRPEQGPEGRPRVEAYGTIDELNSLLGVVIAGSKDRGIISSLKEVQRLLFVAGGDAACELHTNDKVPRIGPADTARLEEMTDGALSKLPSLRNFILPGGPHGAALHFARSVCRRAERRILTASRTREMNPELLPFFNRLSSYLFNLSRLANKKAGKKEDVWTG